MNGQISFPAALILVIYSFIIVSLSLAALSSIIHILIQHREALLIFTPGLFIGLLAMIGLFFWLRHSDSRS